MLRTTAHGRILLGENTELQEELQDILAGGKQSSFVATLLLVCMGGFWMARRGQAKPDTISEGLRQVARGALDTQIELDGRDDLTILADRINETTTRMESAIAQMRVQSLNIAHDLRTPLARLRVQIEGNLIAATEHNDAIEPKVLEAALEQIDRITSTLDALLRLARIESGAEREAFTPIDLAELAAEIKETFRPVVEDAGQTLVLDTSHAERVEGDQDMLVQLVANLTQNAIRYGADNQTIRLQVHNARLAVSDEGPGSQTRSVRTFCNLSIRARRPGRMTALAWVCPWSARSLSCMVPY